MCTFTLAVAGGAVLLLPVSIFANEVLIHYPESYYWKWVHSELIQGISFSFVSTKFMLRLSYIV